MDTGADSRPFGSSSRQPIDIGAQLDAGAWGPYQKLILVLAALAFAVDGLANQTLGLSIPALMKDWGMGRQAFAPILGLGLIGVALGAALGGILGDKTGRRIGLIGSIALFGVFTSLTALVHSIDQMAILRLLAGLGLGSTIPNAAALVAEFTPARRRSVAIGLAMIFIPLGSLLSGLIAAKVLPAFGWRVFFVVGGVLPLLLVAVLLPVLPESPRFLVRRAARHTELANLLARIGHDHHADAVFVDARQDGPKTSVKALFGQATLRDTLALWGAFFACLMALYTFFSWGPVMLAGQGFSLAATSTALAAFNLGGIAGALGSTWLIYRIGSRPTIIWLCLLGIIGAAALGFAPVKASGSPWPMMGAFAFLSFCIGGFQNTLYPLAAHIYPPFAKATGVGAASAIGRIGAVCSSFTGVLSLEWRGASGYFLVLAGILAFGFGCALMLRNTIEPFAVKALGGARR